MEAIVKLLLGGLLLGMGWSFLYRPSLVLKIYELIRTTIFDDFFVLHYRRRLGIIAFVGGVLCLYSGLANLKTRESDDRASFGEIDRAYRALTHGNYDAAIRITQNILVVKPHDHHARLLLKQATASRLAQKAKRSVLAPAIRADK